MQLKDKFALTVSVFVIAMFAIVALFTFLHYKKSVKETIAQQQFRMLSIHADEIDTRLLEAQAHIVSVANSVPVDIMQHCEKAQAFLDSRTSMHVMFDNHLFLFTQLGKILTYVVFSL